MAPTEARLLLRVGRLSRVSYKVLHALSKMASSTQDARAQNANPLMLLACSVNTPIHVCRFHLHRIALRILCA